jgi:hypothetical protein
VEVADQVPTHECAPQTWSPAERPRVGDPPRAAQLPASPRRQFGNKQLLGIRARRLEAHLDAEHATQARQWHPPDQELDHDEDGNRVRRCEEVTWWQPQGAPGSTG